jgi:transcriptional regulator with XRE-family HTH domain
MSTETALSARAQVRASVDAEIGARVHALMWQRRISQISLGRTIGIDQGGVGRRLRGERGWTTAELRAVARELKVSVAFLFGETDDPTPRHLTAVPSESEAKITVR